MKMAKSYKITFLFVTFVLAVCCAFATMNTKIALADEPSSFVYGVTSVFANGNIEATVNSGDKMVFHRDLVVDDFATEFKASGSISKMSLTVSADSNIATGNLKASDGNYYTKIDYVLTLNNNSGSWTAALNGSEAKGVTATDGAFKVGVTAENNFLTFNVNGVSFAETESFYKINMIDKAVATDIRFDFETANAGSFALISVDQKASDASGAYKQTFELINGNISHARPRIVIDNSLFVLGEDGKYVAKTYNGKVITVATTPYSFCGTYSSTMFYLASEDNAWLANTERPKQIRFDGVGEFNFSVNGKEDDAEVVYENYSVQVINKEEDETAPKFFDAEANKEAIDSFVAALNKLYLNAQGEYVNLGTSIEIPSFKSLVYDDTTSYENLTHTLYYFVPTSSVSSNTSGFSFSLNNSGSYVFYVVFADLNGNKMDAESFKSTLDNDEKDFIAYSQDLSVKEWGEYSKFVYGFSINDIAPINVEAAYDVKPDSEGWAQYCENNSGFVGSTYKAPAFKIEASNSKTEYKLFYLVSGDYTVETNWVEIPKAGDVSDKEYNENGYTYDDIKGINFGDSLTFVPNKTGIYKITCAVTSNSISYKADDAELFINIKDNVKTVTSEPSWAENNVWSIVFLSVGTLCLVAIIVILFIKPKEGNAASDKQ